MKLSTETKVLLRALAFVGAMIALAAAASFAYPPAARADNERHATLGGTLPTDSATGVTYQVFATSQEDANTCKVQDQCAVITKAALVRAIETSIEQGRELERAKAAQAEKKAMTPARCTAT